MRILLVDDKAIAAKGLQADIQRADSQFEVTAVTAAGQATEVVRTAQAAGKRYDVLLIDRNLGDTDGIELMEQLRALDPALDAIIFTGFDDPGSGQRAIEAGACDYFAKPLDDQRLFAQLRRLQRERGTREERAWLATLAEVSKELQGGHTAAEIGEIIVQAAPRLGFERARLWLYKAETQELVGLCQQGNVGLNEFTTLCYPVMNMPYSQAALKAGQPRIFKGDEYQPSQFELDFLDKGFRKAVGDRIKVPMIVNNKWIGTLTLDNAERQQRYTFEQLDLLRLFGDQAASALERAQLHEQTRVLNDIGRQVTTQAVSGKLEALLEEVRRQVGHLMDISNFIVVLLDEDSDYLDFRCHYEEGVQLRRHWRKHPAGLCGEVIAKNDALLLSHGGKAYREEHAIPLYGKQSQSWLGVPLRIEQKAVGAIVLQDYERPGVYTEHHAQLLGKVAEQVAGAIHAAHQLERSADQERQQKALQDLAKALPRLIEESEDAFWHAVLTAITHGDGYSFNRAVLFWYNKTGEQMQGRMGIGYFRREDARRAWEDAEQVNARLSDYFAAPQRARLRPTPLEQEVAQWGRDTGAPDGICFQVWAQGERGVVSSAALRGCLPDELLLPPDLLDEATEYPCALLPVRSKDGVLGLLVVDNAFDGEPLRPYDLDKLEELLAQAAQVWLQAKQTQDSQRLGQFYEAVLDLSRKMTAQVWRQPLKACLEELCQRAKSLVDADCVIVYPYQPNRESYDLELVSHVGLDKPHEFKAKTKDKPRQHGVTFTITQSGALVVSDRDRSELSFAGRKLSEHPFLQREGIKALIGVPMRKAATGEPLGVLYLDYRSPRTFSEQDVAVAEQIAAIGAATISHAREKHAVTEAGEQRQRWNMQMLANVQRSALASVSDEEEIIRAILDNGRKLYDGRMTIALALLKWESRGQDVYQLCWDYRLSSTGQLQPRRCDPAKRPIGEALRQVEPFFDHNRLALSLRLDQQPLGVLLLQKQRGQGRFTEGEIELAQKLTTVVEMALANVHTRAKLKALAGTIAAVSDPTDLEETLAAIRDKARAVAPDIDCVTLWYQDLENRDRLIAGPNWGVKGKQHTGHVVRAVMQLPEPLYADDAGKETSLQGEFIRDEDIKSVAAFPLRFGDSPDAIGALFLNYRKSHAFTATERLLFPIFADAAATAIHGAQAVDLAKRRGKRLETALAVATQAGASLKEDEVLRGVLTALRNEFQRNDGDMTAPYIMLHDERECVLELPAVAREFYEPTKPEYRDRVRLPVDGRGITCRTARKALAEKRIVIDNVKDVRDEKEDYVEVNASTRSEMAAGLVSDGRLLGVLVIKSDRPAAFGEEDEKLFETTARQVAIALDRVAAARQRVLDTKRLTVLAWRSEIAHEVRRSLNALSSIRVWFDSYLKMTNNPAPATFKCQKLISASISEFNKMLSTDLFTLDELRFSEFIDQIRNWVEFKKIDAKEWQSISFEFPILESDIILYCDRLLLFRSLQNIITNSIEAKKESELGHIGLHIQRISDNAVEIEIWDNGSGFPEEMYSRIGQEAWSNKEENRGFGLYNATLFLEIMGGSLELRRPDSAFPVRRARLVIRVPRVIKSSSF